MKIPNVLDNEFDEQVLRSSNPVLVAFRASSCAQSRQLAPVIEDVADEFAGQVRFVAVDGDSHTARIKRKYKVNRFPVTMLFDDGRCVDFVGGQASKETIVEMIRRQLVPVRQVDELNFDSEVLEPRLPVLVHFHGAACAQSVPLLLIVESLAEKFRGRAKFARVEFGPDTLRLCARFGVSRVPTLSLFVDGRIEDQIFGQTTIQNVEQMLDLHI